MNEKNEFADALTRMYGPLKRGHVPGIAPVGFNYADALKQLRKLYTDPFLLGQIGFGANSRDTLLKILNGRIPNHLVGEALFVLYTETFKKGTAMYRPVPMHPLQKEGIPLADEAAYYAYLKKNQK